MLKKINIYIEREEITASSVVIKLLHSMAANIKHKQPAISSLRANREGIKFSSLGFQSTA